MPAAGAAGARDLSPSRPGARVATSPTLSQIRSFLIDPIFSMCGGSFASSDATPSGDGFTWIRAITASLLFKGSGPQECGMGTGPPPLDRSGGGVARGRRIQQRAMGPCGAGELAGGRF